MRLPKSLSANSDVEWEVIDGSYVKAHQDSTGAEVVKWSSGQVVK